MITFPETETSSRCDVVDFKMSRLDQERLLSAGAFIRSDISDRALKKEKCVRWI